MSFENTEKGLLPSKTNALAPAQGLAFDGTAGAALSFIAGSADFAVFDDVNPTNFAATRGIVGGAATNFSLYVQTDGTLISSLEGVANNTASTGVLVAGVVSRIGYSRSGSTGTYWINGVAAGTTPDSRNYSSASTALGSSGGAAFFVGTLRLIAVLNRALTAAEVLSLYQSGAPAAGDIGASNTELVVNGDFSSGAGWNTTTGWSIGAGVATANGTGDGGGGTALIRNDLTAVVAGKRYRVTYTLASRSSGVVRIQVGGTNGSEATADGTYIEELVAASTSGNLFILCDLNSGATIDNVSIVQVGLLCAPESNAPGNGYQWKDASGNKADITLPTSGVTWVLPDAKLNRVRTSTSTNGNQQASGQVLIPAPSQITRIRARSIAGTPTITLGTASGGSQLVSSVALTTTWKDLTIALTGGIVSTASSIWVGSNSTDVVETDVSYEPLNT